MKDIDKNLLNEAQRNSLSVSLRLLERRLLFLELLIQQNGFDGMLYSFRVDKDKEVLSTLKEYFEHLLHMIKIMKEKFGLPEKEDKLSSHLKSMANYFWSVFEDERSYKLKRYGDVLPVLDKELDPLIDQIIGYLKQISDLNEK